MKKTTQASIRASSMSTAANERASANTTSTKETAEMLTHLPPEGLSPTDQTSPGVMNVQMIPVKRLRPDVYPTNVMNEKQYQEYLTECQRLGHLPEPIVVRRDCGNYAVVDGPHGLRAAMELGFSKVPCKILNADELKARCQSFKRRHPKAEAKTVGQQESGDELARDDAMANAWVNGERAVKALERAWARANILARKAFLSMLVNDSAASSLVYEALALEAGA